MPERQEMRCGLVLEYVFSSGANENTFHSVCHLAWNRWTPNEMSQKHDIKSSLVR